VPKVILEKCDIELLIKEAYNGCEVVSGLEEFTDIIIKVDNFKPATLPPVAVGPPPKLTETPRKHTIPGSSMGQARGRLPTF